MSDNRFWRAIAVLMVAGVFYVGHGLHEETAELPSLSTPAKASEVTLNHKDHNGLFTASPDGSVIYTWKFAGPYDVEFVGRSIAK